MEIKEKVIEAATAAIDGTNIILLEVKCSANAEIDVTLESMDGISIDKCAEISKYIESKLDREEQDFELTVGSASISDPLVHPIQYKKNIDREVEITLLEEREKIKATITNATDAEVEVFFQKKIEVEGKKRKELKDFTQTIEYTKIKSAKLIF